MQSNTVPPPLDQLPPDVAEVVAPAAEAVDRWRELQRRHADARAKLAAAEETMRKAYAAATRDPSAKIPTDRRPALAEEVKLADELAKRAKNEARAAWRHMSLELRGMAREGLTRTTDATEAATAYRQAIDHLETTRQAYYDATAVDRWVSEAVGLHHQMRPDADAPTYRPRVPRDLPAVTRGSTGTPVTEVLEALRADAQTFDQAAGTDDRTARWLARNPQIMDDVRERAGKAQRIRMSNA